jgi:hypothetical protein
MRAADALVLDVRLTAAWRATVNVQKESAMHDVYTLRGEPPCR